MTKTLYVPDHVIESKKDAASAYINKSEKVLDPSLVGKKLKERQPQHTGWRLLVMPYMGKATTEWDIHIREAISDREALATVVAYD